MWAHPDDEFIWDLVEHHYRRDYERSQNPLYALFAYTSWWELRSTYPSMACPEWLLEFHYRLARTIIDLRDVAHDDESSLPIRLADALGIKRAGRGSRGSAWTNLDLELRDLGLAERIREERRNHPGMSVEDAVANVADATGRKEPLIWAAWRAWRDDGEDS